jgi:tRNA threonylcarbamoyladenosine biosynthesis protein TsaB
MILIIDTSSSIATIATIEGDRATEMSGSARSHELLPYLRELVERGPAVEKVAVVIGPGSFTGLRVGVAFGLGLAMGRRIPIVPLGSLELQAARSDVPVTAVVEAGRGRFYYRVGGDQPALGAPEEIPKTHDLAGNVSDAGREALLAAGHRFKDEEELRPLGLAAMDLLETAGEVAYGSLKLEYMQSFSARI